MYFADGAGSKRMTSVIFQLYFNLSIIHVLHVLNIISKKSFILSITPKPL